MDTRFSLGTLPDGQLVLMCDNVMMPSVIRNVGYYVESKLILLNFLDGQEEESLLIPFELNEEASCLVKSTKDCSIMVVGDTRSSDMEAFIVPFFKS